VKYLVALTVVAMLVCAGSALAEPIYWDYDAAPVNLHIACWVYINFDEGASFDLDVEAGAGRASDTEWFTYGQNCWWGLLFGYLYVPDWYPGYWTWWFGSTQSQEIWCYYAGEYRDTVTVQVSDIDIWDYEGLYTGGMMYIAIACMEYYYY